MLYFDTFRIKNIKANFAYGLTVLPLVFLFLLTPVSYLLADEETPPVDFHNNPINLEESTSSTPPDPILPPENNLKKKAALANEFSGALVYDYSFSIAPGRNGMQPDLTLAYNSQARDTSSIFGQGWTLNIPYIERINKEGVEKLYTDPTFYSSLSDELVEVGSGEYAAKVDNGEFLRYTYANSKWTVTDKNGKKYIFGATAAARQDDSSDATRVYKWMLEEVRDTNDNFVRYEYYKNQGQIYPSKIFYTGHGTADGIFEIEFIRETRSDQLSSSKTGFIVTTNYRIKEIQAKINGSWSKKYTINYSTGDNGITSLLSSVTETGKDEAGTTATLPPTTFEYQLSGTTHWEVDNTWNAPIWINEGTGGMVGDINGDGLDDLMKSFFSGYGSTPEWIQKTYLNNGQGQFVENTAYAPPFQFAAAAGSQYWDYGARLIDVNGDGLLDLISASRSGYTQAYLNTGSGWEEDTLWQPPLAFVYWTTDKSATLANLNGDNLPDIIGTNFEWNGTGYPLVTYAYINDGHGWTRDLNWEAPLDIRATNGTVLVDVNGDGLDDIVKSINGPQAARQVFINNGQGHWIESTTYIPPYDFFGVGLYDSIQDRGFRIFDVNGDTLGDVVSQGYGAFINTGTSWKEVNDLNWNQDLGLGGVWWGNTAPYTSYISNINGDSMPDIYTSKWDNSTNTPYSILVKNKEARVNLLKKITYDTGGSTSVVYTGTPLYRNGTTLLNSHLSLILDTVSQVSQNDGSSNIFTESYIYEGGSYYYNGPFDTKLAGFNKVTKTNSEKKTITYYHQGNSTDSGLGEYQDHISKIGKPYRIEVKDPTGNLFSKTINKWDKASLSNGRSFVKLTQTVESTYDGNSSHKDKATAFTYSDTTGNNSTITEYGVVTGADDGTFTDTGSDKFTTTISYAANTGAGIIGLRSQEIVSNQGSNQIKKTKYYYDGQSYGNVTLGNLTKQEDWKNVGDPDITNLKSYDSYGLINTTTDPRNKVTNYAYDSYHLYPITITNPLNQVTAYTYNYSSGAIKQTTDPNGNNFISVYDGLDRIIEERIPDVAGSGTITKSTTEYTDTANAIKVKTRHYLDASNIVDTYTYFDGLNRKIQERKETATSNQYAVRDFVYSHGLLNKESLPYFSSGTAKTTATTDSDLYTTYSYDALDRITNIATAVGNTITSYNDWKTTVTDPKGKVKDLTYDAYGNLIQVTEHNDSSTPTTSYEYNYLHKLTKITDASGNIRNFTYDAVGNIMTAQDLHSSADTTFGTWTYTHDNAGNVFSRTDPNNHTVNYSYDNINRVLTENYSGVAGVEVSYEYDTCGNGIGQLCEVENTASTTTYGYNKLGQRQTETMTIGTEAFSTGYIYDRQGNQVMINNPDWSQIKYVYDNGGLVNKIQHKEDSDANFSDVVSSITYNPVDLIDIISYHNGSQTTNTYDADKLYRLSHKVTTNGSDSIQDLGYAYDAVGNIEHIVDTSDTETGKTTDYTYDDLHRLSAAHISEAVNPGLEGPEEERSSQGYGYDAIGNMTLNPASGVYYYEGNQGSSYANPHAVTSTDEGRILAYDHNGNVVTEELRTYSWDYNNRLMEVEKDEDTYSYSYDSEGQRIKAETPSNTFYYPTKYFTSADDSIEKHIFLGEIAVASVKGSNYTAAVYTIHADHLTGANVVTNENGDISQLLDYYAFGAVRLDDQRGDYNETRKFTGHEYDDGTGLVYMNARYYDPELGRFLSQDPLFIGVSNQSVIESRANKSYSNYLTSPQTFNAYSYVLNNPLKYVDASGEVAEYFQQFGSYMAQGQREIGGFLNNIATTSNQAGGLMGYGSAFIYSSAASVAYDSANLFDPNASVGDKMLSFGMLGLTIGTGGEGKIGTSTLSTIKSGARAEAALISAERAYQLGRAESSELVRIVGKLYQKNDKILGGTAGVVRFEKETGQLLSPAGHGVKAQERISQLSKFIEQPSTSSSDRKFATELRNDLKNSLKKK